MDNDMQQTRLALSILFIGCLQCLLLLLIGLTAMPEQVGAMPHDQFPGMLIGGDGLMRFEPIRDYGYYFQLLMLAQVCLMIALGVAPQKRTKFFWCWLGLAFLAGSYVWWQLFTGYEAFLESGETEFVAGFPVATAWQVYAVWISGLALVGIYVFGFKQYVWSDADQAAFEALVKSSEPQAKK
jgi:hypothetical protein